MKKEMRKIKMSLMSEAAMLLLSKHHSYQHQNEQLAHGQNSQFMMLQRFSVIYYFS